MGSRATLGRGATEFCRKYFFGFTPSIGDNGLLQITRQREGSRQPRDVQREIRSRIIEQQRESKARFDARRYAGAKYAVGNVVVMKTPSVSTGDSTKLQPAYRGPLVVEEVLPADTYRLRTLNPEVGGRIYNTTAHVSQVKLYLNAGEDDPQAQETFEDAFEIDIPEEEGSEETLPEHESEREESPQTESGRRHRRRPKWWNDYVE